MSHYDAVRDVIQALSSLRHKRRGVFVIGTKGHGREPRRRLIAMVADMMGLSAAGSAMSTFGPSEAREERKAKQEAEAKEKPTSIILPPVIAMFPRLRERPKRRSIYSGRADKRSAACVKEKRPSWSRKLNGVI